MKCTPPVPPSARRQRGAALLMALIIVTLVATLATSMVWQQWRAVQVESAERSRSQSAWILAGALDWARIILKEDARPTADGRSTIDHLGEPWAVPLAEARLSTFLAVDDSQADDAPDTFLSGRIEDAQARYNLANLVPAGNKQVDAAQLLVFKTLCRNITVADTVADTIAEGMVKASRSLPKTVARSGAPAPSASAAAAAASTASAVTGVESDKDAPLYPTRLSDLAWLGVDAETLKRLEPYVWLHPRGEPTPVNANTASREVLAAVISNIDMGSAERVIQARARPFRNLADISTAAGVDSGSVTAANVSVQTSYFIVSGQVRLAGRILEQRSLLERNTSGVATVRPLLRESFNSAEPL